MNAGVLGVVEGEFRVVDSYQDTVVEDDEELSRYLDVQRVFSLPSGRAAFAGRAASEVLRTRETVDVDRGEIRLGAEARREWRVTEFLGVPGEFVVVGSGDGAFAFELLGLETDTTIQRATLDLDGFFERRDEARPWKAGFFGPDSDAVTGVFHGTDLRDNHDLQALLERSRLNQLGLEYVYDDQDLKMTASRSGYVEVYRPTAFDSGAYLDYLLDDVLPHVE
jgi:hypothetical protein